MCFAVIPAMAFITSTTLTHSMQRSRAGFQGRSEVVIEVRISRHGSAPNSSWTPSIDLPAGAYISCSPFPTPRYIHTLDILYRYLYGQILGYMLGLLSKGAVMSKVRNYPAYSLDDAIKFTSELWKKERRNKIPRKLVAERLGYSGLHGVALRKIGSMKAYGLLDGTGDEQQVSPLAVKILEAPDGSRDRDDARIAAALKPPLFSEIHEHFDSEPTLENLRYYLISNGFSPEAAAKAANAYLATISVDEKYKGGYNEEGNEPSPAIKVGDYVQWESQGMLQFADPRRIREISPDGQWAFVDGSDTGMAVTELELMERPEVVATPVKQAVDNRPRPRTFVEAQQSSGQPLTNQADSFRDVFSSPEGAVTIQWPGSISKETFDDLSAWLDIVKRKIGRSIKSAGTTGE
jgi:hypothetical protein